MIIVTCTAPKSSSAPTPAPMRVYASVKATAYPASARAEVHEPRSVALLAWRRRTRIASVTAPVTSRINVNDGASINPSPRAPRVSRLLAAKAISVGVVRSCNRTTLEAASTPAAADVSWPARSCSRA